jgi:hypothetical protein
MSEYATPQPEQKSGASRLQKMAHPLFWANAERKLNNIQTAGVSGELAHYPWKVDVHAGVDGGVLVVEKVSFDEAEKRTITVNFSRDELDGHLTYLRAERVAACIDSGEEYARDRVLAGPREFVVVEFNPLSVVTALHGAAGVVARA